MKITARITVSAALLALGFGPALAQDKGNQTKAPPPPGLTLMSSAFKDGDVIPDKYTQSAGPAAISPKLEWTNVPNGTVTFALILHDPDVLILDEIYTGFGRTGRWFACEHSATVPDLICLVKALTGGFPLSVCVGRADLMDAAWPPSSGEAIHTSTFLGHPVGCAMALAQIEEIEARRLVQRSARLGGFLLSTLSSLASRPSSLALTSRGLGLLVGVEVCSPDGFPATQAALLIVKGLLQRGFILLPEGEHSNIIGFTPPLTVSQSQLSEAVNAFGEELHRCRVT